MIVKMKKVTMLISNGRLSESLVRLRTLGFVHIKHVRKPQAQEMSDIEEALAAVDTIMPYCDAPASFSDKKHPDVAACVQQAASLIEEREKNAVRLRELDGVLEWFRVWGDFSCATINELKQNGIYVRLYVCAKKEFKKHKLRYALERIGETKNSVYCASFSLDKENLLPLQEVALPERDAAAVKKEYHTLKKRYGEINQTLKELCAYKQDILRYKRTLKKKLEFYQVRFGMAKEEGFSYVQGFCPAASVKTLETAARGMSWALFIEDPNDTDHVPTLLKNPRWIEIIRPVFNFMGTLPGYAEFDISGWFLVFFSIFFALLIGDAGYGFLFLGATAFLQKKFKHLDRKPFLLLYVLSITTIIWGVLSGTWFGIEKIATVPFFNYFILEKINSFVDANQSFMMFFCFLIGAIHLTIAHLMATLRYCNSLRALAQVGWICIVWSMFFVAKILVLNAPGQAFVVWLLLLGALLVVLFSYPQKNILQRIATSIGELPLKVINSFSDIISYLRLFAVGYATVIVAATANTMATDNGFHSLLAGFASACILFVGHTINIFLGFLSVIVHGVRLNMLEFSSHLNMEWSGTPYAPFKE